MSVTPWGIARRIPGAQHPACCPFVILVTRNTILREEQTNVVQNPIQEFQESKPILSTRQLICLCRESDTNGSNKCIIQRIPRENVRIICQSPRMVTKPQQCCEQESPRVKTLIQNMLSSNLPNEHIEYHLSNVKRRQVDVSSFNSVISNTWCGISFN